MIYRRTLETVALLAFLSVNLKVIYLALPIFPSHVSARRLRITVLLHMALYKFFYIVLYCIEWDRQRDRQTDRQTVEPSRGRPLQMLCLCLGTATRHIIYLGHFGGRPSQPVTWLVLANITTTK